ncbi:hypothetical protein DFP74_0567 [Nocardiopsis sp. Huas11]|uniref:hypothetical protein n=1 Tax=Nocardiopsis sp. Huas11 TaxID=2183912 RepID=UPI000F19690D|nr:hypothetical protein [Nocardiopsis sp. Huas11]RKS04987.1 hypothetical protein DFP74_0567 [Nocardiopsis sp. Huas11]
MNPAPWRAPVEPGPPSDEPLPPPSDDPLPPPEDPGTAPAPEPEPEETGPAPEITDDPLPPPEDPREGEPPLREQQGPSDEPVELDTDGKVFDCGIVDPGCHVSNWFADFVVSGLNPALGWLAQKAFHTPEPTAGMEALHDGILGTSNVLFVLLIVAGGLVAMCYQTVQSRYSAADILPRAVFAFVASNFSLWVSEEMVSASNQIAAAVGAQGIDAREAAVNLRDRMDVILQEALVFSILLLVVVVVLLVVWMLTEAVRICMVIVLVIGAPLLLMFHALPHTNRIAELWWKSMAGLCAIPIAQSIVFIAMARLFFEGQMTFFGPMGSIDAAAHEPSLVLDTGPGAQSIALASTVLASPTDPGDVADAGWLMNIMLLLVLLYVQIRISAWVMKLVWQPNPGTSPIAAMLKNIAWMMAFRSVGNVRMPRAPASSLRWQFSREKTPGRKLPRYKPKPSGGLQPLQSQAWWYRPRHEAPEPAGALTAGEPRALPGPGGGRPWPGSPPPGSPPALPGQRALVPVPAPRPGPPAPPRRSLEEGRMPGSPKTGQQTLFPRQLPPPTAPGASRKAGVSQRGAGSGAAMPPQRRWRQGVLPTPPPVRVPGRKAPERVGLPDQSPRPSAGLRHLPTMPAVSWGKPPHVKGQQPLFPNPRRVWKQYGLFPRPDQK